jgi:hypothetical protein
LASTNLAENITCKDLNVCIHFVELNLVREVWNCRQAYLVSFDSAKVECDYAIESCFLNRIFNRKAKTLESPVFIGEKIFSIKKVRLALIAQSHSSIAF